MRLTLFWLGEGHCGDAVDAQVPVLIDRLIAVCAIDPPEGSSDVEIVKSQDGVRKYSWIPKREKMYVVDRASGRTRARVKK